MNVQTDVCGVSSRAGSSSLSRWFLSGLSSPKLVCLQRVCNSCLKRVLVLVGVLVIANLHELCSVKVCHNKFTCESCNVC